MKQTVLFTQKTSDITKVTVWRLNEAELPIFESNLNKRHTRILQCLFLLEGPINCLLEYLNRHTDFLINLKGAVKSS